MVQTAPEFDDENVDAPVHTVDERFQQEAGKSWTHGCAVFHALQLLSRPQNTARYTCNGGRANGPRVEYR